MIKGDKNDLMKIVNLGNYPSAVVYDQYGELIDLSKNYQIVNTMVKSADLISCKKGQRSRIVFNIGRNRYRFICGYWFRKVEVVLYVKFVGTHKEYDNIDVCKIDMFIK